MRQALAAGLPSAQADGATRFLEKLDLAADPAQALAAAPKIAEWIKSDPAEVPALMAWAASSEQRPDLRAARKAYEDVLARYPDFSPAQRRLAILYAADPGEVQKGYELATKARAAFPGDAEITKALGIIIYRQGDFTRAARLLAEGAGARPDDAEVRYYLGMTQRRLRQDAESRASLQRALALKLSNDLAEEARRVLAEK